MSKSAARQQRVAVVGGTALGGLLDQGASVEEAVRCVLRFLACLFFVLRLVCIVYMDMLYAPHKATTPHHNRSLFSSSNSRMHTPPHPHKCKQRADPSLFFLFLSPYTFLLLFIKGRDGPGVDAQAAFAAGAGLVCLGHARPRPPPRVGGRGKGGWHGEGRRGEGRCLMPDACRSTSRLCFTALPLSCCC